MALRLLEEKKFCVQIIHPAAKNIRDARNLLLQKALRHEVPAFPIEREYPLVLGAEGYRYSYCLEENGEILAHANLWPRRLKLAGDAYLDVGLIGNVATDENHRGKGLMRRLLAELKIAGERQGLKALILWSDLEQFYAKQGFEPFGLETRYRFPLQKTRRESRFVTLSPSQVNPQSLLAVRFPTTSALERSSEEFKSLLQIPGLTCVARLSGTFVEAFGLIGKGADMVGVIHEWGAESPADLLDMAAFATAHLRYQEIMLLAPKELPTDWAPTLNEKAESKEEHPVGLAWARTEGVREALAECFIWGLDSI